MESADVRLNERKRKCNTNQGDISAFFGRRQKGNYSEVHLEEQNKDDSESDSDYESDFFSDDDI